MAAKEKKGLGTGLDALFGSAAFDDEEAELLTLPISKVEPRSEQPRKYFDEDALQELADSIAQYGLIQPITVRKQSSGYYQIIAGERRWRASRLAGLTEVPVRVIEADDRRTAELALVENLQREDLNPIEEAKGYKSLIEDYGLTQEEAAKSVGRSRPAIANSMRLLSLSPAVLEHALRQAGATILGEETGRAAPALTKADLYACGLSGGENSREKRKKLLAALGLPEHLSPNAMLPVLSALYSREDLLNTLQKLQ